MKKALRLQWIRIGTVLAVAGLGCAKESHKEQPPEKRAEAHPEPAVSAAEPILLDWIPEGAVDAVRRDLSAPVEAERAALQFKESVARHPKWFAQYVAEHDGNPLPYHPNMGIDQEQYELLVSGKALQLAQARAAPLVFTREADWIRIDGGGELTILDQLDLRVRGDGTAARTGKTQMTPRAEVEASSHQKLTGPWNGICWGKSYSARLCLGQMGDGRGLLIYEARDEEINLVLQFESEGAARQ